jgi:poly(3-hydroxyalkanoate) depolymerase
VTGVQIDWFDYGGLRIRYGIRVGSEALPLLVFNGVGQSIEVLQPMLDTLPETTIITLDVPGAGLSDIPARPWRYREHARLALALCHYLGYHRFNVMGISWGGGLAQQFTRLYPAAVEKMILAASPPGNLMVPGSPRVYLRMANPRRFLDRDYLASIAGHIYGGDTRRDDAAVRQLMSLLQPPSRRGYAFQTLAMYGWTGLHFLPRLKQPTLILQGSDDPMVPNINARIMACLIPRSRLEFVDCGHLFILTRLERVSRLIREFAYA